VKNINPVNPFLLADVYKVGHVFQYPQGTQFVYSNMTPRESRLHGIDSMVVFGVQHFVQKYLIDYFNHNFFWQPKDKVLSEYARTVHNILGAHLPTYEHIAELYDLGYLPLHIKALPEGSIVPLRVPFLTIVNTNPDFYWLTNFVETIMSTMLWQACTSATIAHEYRLLLNHYAKLTGVDPSFVGWQGHDFSFRGMSSLESAELSGMGHLLSFTGTDTIPAIVALENYYNADSDKELIGGSVPATEHSIQCAGGINFSLENVEEEWDAKSNSWKAVRYF
jgi:nicotinamide phosphoribosyltransferase